MPLETEATRRPRRVGEKRSRSRPAPSCRAGRRRGSRAAGGDHGPRDCGRSTEAREGTDFFPLTVDIEENMYAAGKIPGGFFKREGRASEKATLNARMVDRPIRPLWPKGFRNEVQIIGRSRPTWSPARHPRDQRRLGGTDDLAAAVLRPDRRRPGRPDRGRAEVNPTMPEMQDSTLDLIVCGTRTRSRWSRPAPRRSSRRSDRGARAGARRDQAALPAPARAGSAGRQAKWYEPPSSTLAARTRGVERPRQARPGRASGRAPTLVSAPRCPAIAPTPARRRAPASRAHSRRAFIAEARTAAVNGRRGAVRRRDPCAVRRGAGLEGAEVGQAARADRAHAGCPSCPSRAAPRAAASSTPPPGRDQGRGRLGLQVDRAHKIAVEKRRPDGRSENEIRPITCDVEPHPRTHGSASSRAARRRR